MADTRLTKIGLFRALLLCAFAAFCSTRLVEAERSDEEARKQLPQSPPPETPWPFKLRRALWASLGWVIASLIVGYLFGKLLGAVSDRAPTYLVVPLQICGATLLLWATLFVRGWDIQSCGGVTLTERVNRWTYRSLHFLGTALVVASLTLT